MNQRTLDDGNLGALLGAHHGDPFAVLGMHPVHSGPDAHHGQNGQGGPLAGQVVRVFRPDAREVVVEQLGNPDCAFPALCYHEAGYFEAFIPNAPRFAYQLRITGHDGAQWTTRDPYSFNQLLGALDLHLFAEGNHWEIYEKFGAHLATVDGEEGSFFAVWAPNAQRVSVVGDWNQWDGRVHPMRKHPGAGVWEIFLPGIREGAHYKFEILSAHGQTLLKCDPFAFYAQHSQQTAGIVFDLNRYQWSDQQWMVERKDKAWHRQPVSIYEVHLGSWQRVPEEGNRPLSYIELADRLLNYVCALGYTHIELMPIAEHPFDGSWGYQITGYYAPTSRFGNPDEFRHFVDKCHQRGIGVILDWVPGHFPKDAHGLAEFDGTDLFEHADPRQGEHADWGTLIFNYGRNEVRNFLIANALFWLEKYHIDGLRVDAVASMLYLDYSRKSDEWVPNCFGGRENLEAIAFLKQFNETCYGRHPGILTIAEESTAWPAVSRPTYLGGLGFGMKWNMGWMHDFLNYMGREPIYRRYHQGDITFSLLYAFHEQFVLVLSHDEVVHGKRSLIDKMPGDLWQKFANLRLLYAWMYAYPGKKLLFQGGEFGQWEEWNHEKSLDWHLTRFPLHDGLRRLVQHLNWFYKNEPALWSLDDTYDGFEWIDFHDSDDSVISFIRKGSDGSALVFVVNATPVVRSDYRVGVPGDGWYAEVLNTDSETYGGSNVGNYGGQQAQEVSWQGKSHSLNLRLPPLAVIAFKRQPPPVPPEEPHSEEEPTETALEAPSQSAPAEESQSVSAPAAQLGQNVPPSQAQQPAKTRPMAMGLPFPLGKPRPASPQPMPPSPQQVQPQAQQPLQQPFPASLPSKAPVQPQAPVQIQPKAQLPARQPFQLAQQISPVQPREPLRVLQPAVAPAEPALPIRQPKTIREESPPAAVAPSAFETLPPAFGGNFGSNGEGLEAGQPLGGIARTEEIQPLEAIAHPQAVQPMETVVFPGYPETVQPSRNGTPQGSSPKVETARPIPMGQPFRQPMPQPTPQPVSQPAPLSAQPAMRQPVPLSPAPEDRRRLDVQQSVQQPVQQIVQQPAQRLGLQPLQRPASSQPIQAQQPLSPQSTPGGAQPQPAAPSVVPARLTPEISLVKPMPQTGLAQPVATDPVQRPFRPAQRASEPIQITRPDQPLAAKPISKPTSFSASTSPVAPTPMGFAGPMKPVQPASAAPITSFSPTAPAQPQSAPLPGKPLQAMPGSAFPQAGSPQAFRPAPSQRPVPLAQTAAQTPKPVQITRPVPTTKPVQPIQTGQPIPPGGPIQPLKLTQPIQPIASVPMAQPTQPAASPQAARPAEPPQSAAPAQLAQPVKPLQAISPGQKIKSAQPTSPIQMARTTQAISPGQPARPMQPAQRPGQVRPGQARPGQARPSRRIPPAPIENDSFVQRVKQFFNF